MGSMSKSSFTIFLILVTIFFNFHQNACGNSFINWDLIDTSNSNLPSNNISDITNDRDGAIWVSTDNGFAKYLGQNNWEVFHTPNITFGDVCLSIVSQDSIIWVATVNGLVRYCNSQLTVFNDINSSLGTPYIISLAVESDKLWVGTFQYGLYVYDGISFQNFNYMNTGNMPLGNVWSINVGEDGVKWMSCADARVGAPNLSNVLSYDNSTWNLYDTTNSDIERFSRGVSIDIYNNKWITDLQGHLKKYDDINWFNFDSSNVFPQAVFEKSEVAFDSVQNKWMCTSTGISKFNDTNWTFYDSSNVPFSNAIKLTSCIFVDSTDNKYIGTHNSGLLIFNENGIVDDINYLNSENDVNFSSYWVGKNLNISLNTLFDGFLNLSIINSSGKIIENSKLNTRPSQEIQAEFDFTNESQGLYFVQVEMINRKMCYKIIYMN